MKSPLAKSVLSGSSTASSAALLGCGLMVVVVMVVGGVVVVRFMHSLLWYLPQFAHIGLRDAVLIYGLSSVSGFFVVPDSGVKKGLDGCFKAKYFVTISRV